MMEWVLLLFKKRKTDIVVIVGTCSKFRILWNSFSLLSHSEREIVMLPVQDEKARARKR